MSDAEKQLPGNYPSFLKEVKSRIHEAQYAALKAVNRELVGLYWDIGRMIVDRQVGESWGKINCPATGCRFKPRVSRD